MLRYRIANGEVLRMMEMYRPRTPRPGWGSRLRRAVLVALAVGTVTNGCSIGAEESPRTWSDWDPFDTPPPSSASGVDRVYFLEDRYDGDTQPRLTAVKRDLDGKSNVYREILEVLLRGPTSDELQQGLESNIPIGVDLGDDPQTEATTVTIDLSEELTVALGDDLVDALAQIVWTMCDRPSVRQVRILVEGQAVSLPRADGVLVDRPLTPFDYARYVRTSQPDFPGVIETFFRN